MHERERVDTRQRSAMTEKDERYSLMKIKGSI